MSVRGRATGTDVARVAGVSKSAVSRAFTGGLVSEDARARIFAAARQLKYRPSFTARSLSTRQSRMIGIAVTHLDNQFYPEVIEKFSDGFAQAGYRLLLFVTHGDADLDPVMDELLGYRLDGVVLASSSLASRVAAECVEADVPVVMFNSVDPEGKIPGIATDEVAGAKLVARYLLAAGHERFGVITGLLQSTTSVRRHRAFREEVIAAGFDKPIAVSGEYTFEGAREAALSMLRSKEAPDAIFCVNDHMALGALHAVRDLGLTPGKDVSIVGFDNVAISKWPVFSLTTLAQPVELMVQGAISGLINAIERRPTIEGTVSVPGRLLVRKSARLASGVEQIDIDEYSWNIESQTSNSG